MFTLEKLKIAMEKKEKKIKKYSVADDSIVTAISMVTEPAIETNFQYFSKDKPRYIAFESEEKHMVIGPALIPDLDIYRYDAYSDEEFYISFSKDVIEKLAHNYLKGQWMPVTEQHETYANEVFLVESWLKTSENDKSADYGFGDLPIGTWFCQMYVNNVDLWNKIKEGELRGFSIESWINIDEVVKEIDNNQNKQNIEMAKETIEINENFWTKLREVFTSAMKLEEDKPAEEEAPAVEEEVKDIVEEVVAAAEEVAEETVAEENNLEEEEAPAEEEVKEEEANVLQEVVDALKEEIDALKADLSAVKAENEELKATNAKLSKMPSAKPAKAEGEVSNDNFKNFRNDMSKYFAR